MFLYHRQLAAHTYDKALGTAVEVILRYMPDSEDSEDSAEEDNNIASDNRASAGNAENHKAQKASDNRVRRRAIFANDDTAVPSQDRSEPASSGEELEDDALLEQKDTEDEIEENAEGNQ